MFDITRVSSFVLDFIGGTVQNTSRRTINPLSKVRAKVYSAAGVLLAEDADSYGPVPNRGEATFDIRIPTNNSTGASYYTLEVTNYVAGRHATLSCSGCGRRDW